MTTTPTPSHEAEALPTLPVAGWRADDHSLPHFALTREGLGLLGSRYGYALTPHAPGEAAIVALRDERDAAFAMSRCECSSDEGCANLAKLRAEKEQLTRERNELNDARNAAIGLLNSRHAALRAAQDDQARAAAALKEPTCK